MRAGGQSSPSLSHLPAVSILVIAELARGAGGAEISSQISALVGV